MSGVKIVGVTPAVALVAATKKTILQWISAANHRVMVKEWSVSFDGPSNTAVPAICEVIEQSDAGSGGDAGTVSKYNPSDSETIQTTALQDIDGSTQPTDTAVKFREHVHPQGGYTWQAPFGDEIPVPGGGRLGLAVTVPSIVNVIGRFLGDE